MNLLEWIRGEIAAGLAAVVEPTEELLHQVRPAQEAKFGDYQANFAMALVKSLGMPPRAIAERIRDALNNPPWAESIEIAGPGFINLRLSSSFLQECLARQWADERLGVATVGQGKTAVIDFSSPNVAKPMHVGHLRSTIIGDAIARIHRALGWTVLTDNHLGDWGTQFGMLIHGWRHFRDEQEAQANPIGELARLYKLVNKMAEEDEAVAQAARDETARLHQGHGDNHILCQPFMPWCLEDLARNYHRLGITFDHQYGESFYQPMLPGVVQKLLESGIAAESDGAVCVFFPDPSGAVDDEGRVKMLHPPFIVRKQDSAFTYATSDLACIEYRAEHFHPDLVLYVVDDRQSLHFEQLFETARRWGFDHMRLEHVAFGKILGKDGKPYKTREGGTVGLEALLDEAVSRARAIVDAESPHLSPEERTSVAEVVGIGAVKYADLAQNRISDYVFDWDKMISMQGNTATYLQYAYARNRSIFRKGEVDPDALRREAPPFALAHPAERALGLALLQYPEWLEAAAHDFRPNLLCNYLFSLAGRYSTFFQQCHVLNAETEESRRGRLALCDLTARVLRAGLDLLGIRTAERL